MSGYRDIPSRTSRASTLGAIIVAHLAIAALILMSPGARPRPGEQDHTVLLDLREPPPPPPPPPPTQVTKAPAAAGTAGKRANPSPVVAPPLKIALPPANPLPAAPVAGSGSPPSSGAASAGAGSGGGGTGSGAGGGGAGSGGTGIGEDARLLSGGLDRRDYRRLRSFATPSGRAVLAIMIGPEGRVTECSIRQSSGNGAVDTMLCAILQPRMRWAPARDRSGRALTVGIYYTAIWDRY